MVLMAMEQALTHPSGRLPTDTPRPEEGPELRKALGGMRTRPALIWCIMRSTWNFTWTQRPRMARACRRQDLIHAGSVQIKPCTG